MSIGLFLQIYWHLIYSNLCSSVQFSSVSLDATFKRTNKHYIYTAQNIAPPFSFAVVV